MTESWRMYATLRRSGESRHSSSSQRMVRSLAAGKPRERHMPMPRARFLTVQLQGRRLTWGATAKDGHAGLHGQRIEPSNATPRCLRKQLRGTPYAKRTRGTEAQSITAQLRGKIRSMLV